MGVKRWLKHHTSDLTGKTVAITGATGGLGGALCRHLLAMGAALILLDRNQAKSAALQADLMQEFPNARIHRIPLDLSELSTVCSAADALTAHGFDCLIHNAGAYSIPRCTCDTGFDNVFQINFVSPYVMTRRLLPYLRAHRARVVAVGSIAHNYAKTDPSDVDFSTRQKASLVYGNAKRYLMYALHELFARKENREIPFALGHPGITFTGITDHYPPLLFALIKHPMKVIFMRPRKAALSVLQGVFEATPDGTWFGPWLFDVWGKPTLHRLHTADEAERAYIANMAEKIYQQLVWEETIC